MSNRVNIILISELVEETKIETRGVLKNWLKVEADAAFIESKAGGTNIHRDPNSQKYWGNSKKQMFSGGHKLTKQKSPKKNQSKNGKEEMTEMEEDFKIAFG